MQKLTFAVFLSLLAAHAAHGATFDVTNTDATGPGSFRQAMIDANASLDASNTIQVANGLSGTITPQFISSDLPLINSQTLIINGPGADLLTLDLSSFQRLTLTSNVITFRINDLAISGGTAFRGGCLNSEHGAELLLSGVRFEDCTAVTTNTPENARGGAIYSTGMVVVADSTFVNNKAIGNTDAGAEGGAIYLQPQSVGKTLTIRRSVLSYNDASSEKDGAFVSGGAIRVIGGVTVLIEDSGFIANHTILEGSGSSGAGGAISGLFGGLTVRRSLFYVNSSAGGGSALDFSAVNPADRPVTDIENNSFFENSGNQNGVVNNGAAIFLNRSALRMRNNGFRNNSAGSGAGSIHYGGEIDLVAVANNAFDVDDHNGSPSCGLSFSITPDDSFAGSHNYFSDGSCTWLASAGAQYPSLNLGATTWPATAVAFALMPISPSPLIDGATDGESDVDWTLCPTSDQVGRPRPQDDDGDGTARCTAGPAENAYHRPAEIFSHGFED
ncbi:MAG: hypothetical protein R3F22_10465 [Lysobacteraceae bacterium]